MGQADIDAGDGGVRSRVCGGGRVVKQVPQRLEANLDPAHPTGVTVLAYGEISPRPCWCRV